MGGCSDLSTNFCTFWTLFEEIAERYIHMYEKWKYLRLNLLLKAIFLRSIEIVYKPNICTL